MQTGPVVQPRRMIRFQIAKIGQVTHCLLWLIHLGQWVEYPATLPFADQLGLFNSLPKEQQDSFSPTQLRILLHHLGDGLLRFMDQPALLIHRHDFADAHVERIHTSLPDTVLECRQARGAHP